MIQQPTQRTFSGASVRRVGVGLGANLGDRLATLKMAVQALKMIADFAQPVLISSLYETAPIGCALGTPSFYNAVMEFGFYGDPLELLQRTQMIEQACGRPAEREKNAPRTLDVDILYFDQIVRAEPPLIVPHPQMPHRHFVLVPLAEIRPTLLLPRLNLTVKECLAQLEQTTSQEIKPIANQWWE